MTSNTNMDTTKTITHISLCSEPSLSLHLGDCLAVLKTMEPNSVDSIVTDPPYGLSFMGKEWDHGVPGVEFWKEALRVAKPGCHLLAFGGTRTYHRLACAIEDAGWEIRDCVMWVYGSGFPKSLDVSKAIDKAAGAERGTAYKTHGNNKVFGKGKGGKVAGIDRTPGAVLSDPHATESAKKWQGWGTALKPAWEPIIVARKPLIGTVANNVLKHGTGAINVDGCRVGTEDKLVRPAIQRGKDEAIFPLGAGNQTEPTGRFPANVIHDGSDEVLERFPDSNQGSAARFFYCAKASKKDRGEANGHPTVKPTALMRYLCKLVTPPNGLVLDPFCGSGSTGKGAVLEGFRFLGIEREQEYLDIAKARIEFARKNPRIQEYLHEHDIKY